MKKGQENKNKSNLDQLKYGEIRFARRSQRRNTISRRSISRFSRNESRRSHRKDANGSNSKITNLLQIIQDSNKMVSMSNDLTGIKSKLKMVHMDVTFSSKAGEKICLMGRSNSGCSELLMTVCGETIITQGIFA